MPTQWRMTDERGNESPHLHHPEPAEKVTRNPKSSTVSGLMTAIKPQESTPVKLPTDDSWRNPTCGHA
jgi:hypothetical protein